MSREETTLSVLRMPSSDDRPLAAQIVRSSGILSALVFTNSIVAIEIGLGIGSTTSL